MPARARSNGTARAAPDASPRRIPRSSSGAMPRAAASRRRWPASAEAWAIRGSDRGRLAARRAKRRGGGGAGEAVEQYRDAVPPCGEGGAQDRREFASAEAGGGLQRESASEAGVAGRGRASIAASRLRARPASSTPVPRPAQSAPVAAEQGGGTGRRRPWCCRCPSRPGTAGRCPGAPRPWPPGDGFQRTPAGDIAGASVKSAVGMSSDERDHAQGGPGGGAPTG